MQRRNGMEKLYNNIELADGFTLVPSDASHVPYLENPPEVIDISVGRQLFVDDFLIEKTDLSPVYHKAKKYEGNPILAPETAWEREGLPCATPKSGGVFFDEEEGKFKMWYEAGWLHHLCYAESADGIRWERPNLHEVEGTNIILPYEGYSVEKQFDGVLYPRPDSTTVFIDYDAPKEERYKIFLRVPGPKLPGIVAVSADGIHFDRRTLTGEVYDRTTMFYNPFRKKWVFSIRSLWEDSRARSYRECDDFFREARWEEGDARHWMAADEKDPVNPYTNFTPQLYNVDCVGYESIMLGLFQVHNGPENDVLERSGAPKITELIPMYSRDGYHFSRPSRKPIIGASMHEGAWDRGYIQSVGGVCVVRDDELWIYYIGFRGDENTITDNWMTSGMYSGGATGLATLRRDGFVSMEGSGTLLTRVLECRGKSRFFINAQGTVTVRILSEEGTLLATSDTFSGDHTRAELAFADFDIASLNGRRFRLEFLVDGHLYAFGLSDRDGDFGGAHGAGFVRKK